MKKILFFSFRWNDQRLRTHSSDMMMSFGFKKAGWDVSYFDYREEYKTNPARVNDNAFNILLKVNPDILFLNKCERLSPSIITKARKKGFKGAVVYWNMDARKHLVPSVVQWKRVSDWAFECKAGYKLKEYYAATNTPTSLLFSPFNPEFIKPKVFKERTYNVSFYGQLYDPHAGFDIIRRKVIPEVRDLLDDYGACFDKTFIRGEDYYGSLGNSLMSISIPAIDLPFYFSNRHSHIMGSAVAPLSYAFKDYDQMFADGHNIITFKDSEELRKKVLYYLNNKDELNQICQQALLFAYEYMHYYKVYEEIIYVLCTGESSYPYGEIINPDRRKIMTNA